MDILKKDSVGCIVIEKKFAMGFAEAHNSRSVKQQENVVNDGKDNIYLTALDDSYYLDKEIKSYVKNGGGESVDVKYKGIDYDKIFDEIKQKYKENMGKPWEKRKGPRVGKSEIFKEMSVNTLEKTTRDDLIKLTKNLEKMGISVLEVSLHNDEGHIDEETNKLKMNHHAHIIFANCDDKGNVKLWKKRDYQKLQDIAAETLGMERGERGSKAQRLTAKQYKKERVKDNELAKNIEKIESDKAYEKIGNFFGKKMDNQEKAINELSNFNNELITKNNELESLFKALGLDEYKQSIEDSKKKYKDDREALKASGVATQDDYKQLKLDFEKLNADYKKMVELGQEMVSEFNKVQNELNELKNPKPEIELGLKTGSKYPDIGDMGM